MNNKGDAMLSVSRKMTWILVLSYDEHTGDFSNKKTTFSACGSCVLTLPYRHQRASHSEAARPAATQVPNTHSQRDINVLIVTARAPPDSLSLQQSQKSVIAG